MSFMLSVDPGTRSCGVALWLDGVLLRAGVVTQDVEGEAGPRECATMARAVNNWCLMNTRWLIDVIAVEVPQVYQRAAGKSKVDPNKVLPIYGVVGALAAAFYHCEDVRFGTPRDWKGGVGKPDSVKKPYAIQERVLERLTPEERSLVEWPKNKRHGWDVADALGVGLHHLGRFDRVRTFARE